MVVPPTSRESAAGMLGYIRHASYLIITRGVCRPCACVWSPQRNPHRYPGTLKVDAGQIQRVAAAVNGLDVAFRWMGRLGELAHGIRSNREDSAPAVQTIDLSGDNAVFLGGSCGGTNWRTDVVIPLLEAVG